MIERFFLILDEHLNGFDRLTNNPEALADLFITQSITFVRMIFSNFSERFTEIDQIAPALDVLSRCDILMSEYREDALKYYGLGLSIRAAMVYNEATAKGWQPVHGYKNLFNKNQRDTEKHAVRPRATICDYNSFMKIIDAPAEMQQELSSGEEYNFEWIKVALLFKKKS